MSEEYYSLAMFHYQNEIFKDPNKFFHFSETAFDLDSTYYPARLAYADSLFRKKEIDKAFKITTNSEKYAGGDASWKYSLAFLFAYNDNLPRAERIYRNAFSGPIDLRVITNVEQYISDILKKEPRKSQLYYALGLINKFAKSDNLATRRDFQEFININSSKPAYKEEIEKAKIWINEINKKIQNES